MNIYLKPRIHWDGHLRVWFCVSAEWVGMGETPHLAYLDWQER